MAEKQKIEFVLLANINDLQDGLKSAKKNFAETAKAIRTSLEALKKIKGPQESLIGAQAAAEKLNKILDQISKRKNGPTILDQQKLNETLLEYQSNLKQAQKQLATKSGKDFIEESTIDVKEYNELLKKTITQFKEARKELAQSAVENRPLESRTFKESSTLEQQLRAEEVKNTNKRAQLARDFYAEQRRMLQGMTLAEKEAYVQKNQYDQIYAKSVILARKQIREEIAKTNQQQTVGLIAERYALYDVAAALKQASGLLIGFSKNAFTAQFEQEKAFSQVQKTLVEMAEKSPDAIGRLRDELVDLTTVIPKSFDEISKIAAIGSQMGIAADELAKFTEVVSKFTATTGVTVEEASLAFGRMANLLPDIDSSKFDELGSAIAYVGVKSVATEGEIISISKQISAISASAGFSASQVVGLSAALASLGNAPEESRGVLVRTFGEIRKAIADSGEKLDQFASISGMSADQFKQAWGEDAGSTFQKFVAGLGDVDTVTALKQLGLDSIRTTKILTSLGDNAELVFRQMAFAEEGMSNGYLEKTFATTVDDIIVRINLMNQSIQNLFAGMVGNEAILSLFGMIVDSINSLAKSVKDLNDNPVSSFISTLMVSFVGLAGIILGVVGAAAMFKASLLAMQTAIMGLVASAETSLWLKAFLSGLFNIEAGAYRTSAALTVLQKSAVALKYALPALAVISIAAMAISHSLGEAERQAEATRQAFGNFEGISEVLEKDASMVGVWAKAQKVYNRELTGSTEEQEKAKAEAENLARVLGEDLVEGATAGAAAVGATAGVYGQATSDFIKARMAASPDFQELFKRDDFASYWVAIGADIDVFTSEIVPKGRGAIQKYFAELTLEAQAQGKEIPPLLAVDFFDAAISGISGSKATTALDQFIDLTGGVDKEIQRVVNTNEILGDTAEETAAKIRQQTDELIELALQSMGYSDSSVAVEESLYNLGKALAENGDDFSEYTTAGRDNIQAVNSVVAAFAKDAEGDSSAFAASINGLVNSLIAGGYKGSAVVEMLRNSVSNLVDDSGKPITFDVNFQVAIDSVIQGALDAAETEVEKTGGRVQTALEKMVEKIENAFKRLNNIIDMHDSLENLAVSLIENGRNFSVFSQQGRDNLQSVQDAIDSLAQRSNGNTQKFGRDLDALRRVLENSGFKGSGAIRLINKAMQEVGANTKASTKEVKAMAKALNGISDDRLLAVAKAADSLASRLNSLFSASIQGTIANLEMAAGFEDMAKKVEDAKQEIKEAQLAIEELTANKGILQYQLQIALKYGDTLRANELRAQLNKIDADIAEKQASILTAQNDLSGNSPAAELQRLKMLEDQANKINTAFANLALQGDMTKKELRGWIDTQTELFYKSAIAAGMSEEDARTLADEIKTNLYNAIKKVPKLKVDTDGANASVNSLKANIASVKGKTVTITTVYKTVYDKPVTTSSTSILGSNNGLGYSTGGMVVGPGSGTSDSISAKLSNGEYVIRASAVKHYGADFMNALNNQTLLARPMSGTSSSSVAGPQVMYLSPEDRNLLRQAIDRPINLYTDSTKIAQTANAGNVILAQRGIN